MSVSVQFIGPWPAIHYWLYYAKSGELTKNAGDMFEKLGKDIKDAIVKRVKSGGGVWEGGAWPALTERTLAIRRSRGISGEDPYIETGAFLNDITVKVTQPEAFKARVTIGNSAKLVPQKRSGKKYAVTYQTLAAYLEYGTSIAYARPLWRPTLERFKRTTKWKKFLQKLANIPEGTIQDWQTNPKVP